MLLVAAFIAATFLDAGAHDSIAPRTPVIGVPVDTPTTEPTATATLPPPSEIEIPDGSWLVEYYEGDNTEASVATFVQSLDLEYPYAPFGDFHDNEWHLEARADLTLEAGQQTFTVVHDGAIRVLVNGEQVAADADPADGERSLVVLFPFDGGKATIRIVAVDESGPLIVRWR
jgi:hypothetical protein